MNSHMSNQDIDRQGIGLIKRMFKAYARIGAPENLLNVEYGVIYDLTSTQSWCREQALSM